VCGELGCKMKLEQSALNSLQFPLRDRKQEADSLFCTYLLLLRKTITLLQYYYQFTTRIVTIITNDPNK
jgi:hypothetical protein